MKIEAARDAEREMWRQDHAPEKERRCCGCGGVLLPWEGKLCLACMVERAQEGEGQ